MTNEHAPSTNIFSKSGHDAISKLGDNHLNTDNQKNTAHPPAPAHQTNTIIVTRDNRDQALAGLPLLFRLATNIAQRLHYGTLILQLPDGRALKFIGVEEQQSQGVIIVRNYDFARRTLLNGDIGFFESFADGQWDTPDLAGCLYVFARNADHMKKAFESSPVIAWIEKLRHALNKNTLTGSKRNIMAHYDLGNNFYEKWLDRTMTYSSARYPSDGAALEDAQTNKYRTLAQAIDLKPGDKVLEIGCGWGGFAEFAAKEYGACVTGLTISEAQLNYAQKRIQKNQLGEKASFRLQDYRTFEGEFDKIASIEMFEAVGKEYWPAYFDKLRTSLKPGGLAGLQIITIADRLFDHYRSSPDFIQRYVFPGGMLASPAILKTQIAEANLNWREAQAFGQDYARTLNEWYGRFLNAWDDIASMGFNERFKKLWRFYLAYCEAGFRAQTTDVMQVSLARP